jgi:hypothetical protein
LGAVRAEKKVSGDANNQRCGCGRRNLAQQLHPVRSKLINNLLDPFQRERIMLTRLLGTLFLLILVVAAVAWANGWIQFHPGENSTTIEMKTDEMKKGADKAIDQGKQLLEKARDELKDFGNKDKNESADQPKEPDSEGH